jgi:hypothetical protein
MQLHARQGLKPCRCAGRKGQSCRQH